MTLDFNFFCSYSSSATTSFEGLALDLILKRADGNDGHTLETDWSTDEI